MNSKLSRVNASAKTPKPWVGCDVAKASFDAGIWTESKTERPRDLKDIPVKSFERTQDGVQKFVNWVLEQVGDIEFRVVMEATGKYSTELTIWMIGLRSSLAPAIINPMRARKFAESLPARNKTDRTDARVLARYGGERRPAAFEPLTAQQAELRDLSRHRTALIGMRVAEENRAKEPTNSPFVRKQLRKHIAQLRRDEKNIEEEMKKLIAKTPDMKRDAKALQGVYGIGFVSAATVLAELGDLRRFLCARQLTAYAGVSPCHKNSGASVRKRTRMSKQGPPQIRRALYMIALTAIRADSDLSDFYQHLLAEKKTKMAALGAVMRKLLVVMRAILISGEPYVKHYRKPVHNH